MYKKVFELIKSSLWGTEMQGHIDTSVYEEMKKQAISNLPAGLLSVLDMDETLRNRWKKDVIQQISIYVNYRYEETRMPINVPYVILKGSAAAQYYSHPEYRCMGDIDIMTKREDFQKACENLINNGWNDVTSKTDQERGRHRAFRKNHIIIEIHAFFASMNDVEQAKRLDDMIIDNINASHYLPDLINGLILIDHINQHMEDGLGLRQIIDWMMFVNKCLTDERWVEFYPLVTEIGLNTLALTTTRMCELFLGLPEHRWAAEVDETICSKLMDYILSCGNFGNKIDQIEKMTISRAARLRHPVKLVKQLQEEGTFKRMQTQKHFLRLFSWLWQGSKYIKETPRLFEGMKTSKRLDNLFEALEIKRENKGLVYYKDGKYYKKVE